MQRLLVAPNQSIVVGLTLSTVIAVGSLPGTISSCVADETVESDADVAASEAAEDEDIEVNEPNDGVAGNQQNGSQTAAAMIRVLGRAFGSVFGFDQTGYATDDEELITELVGEKAPAFALQSTTGEAVTLEGLRGKVVVLDFWATWCAPCMAAMPQLQAVHEHFQDQPVVVIGINQQEELESIQEVLEQKEFDFLQLLDPDDAAGDAFFVSAIPQTVVVDAKGIVQAVHVGYSPRIKRTLTTQIEKLLQGEDLFDREKLAEARAKREAQRQELIAKLGPMNPERLVRLDDVLVNADLTISNNYTPSFWSQLPGQTERGLIFLVGSENLVTVHPEMGQGELIELEFDDEASVWDYCSVVAGEQVYWAMLGAKYDDNYDITHIVCLLNNEGKQVWSHDLENLIPDEAATIDIAAGDFSGDGTTEIATVTDYDGLAQAKVTGPDGSTRVLRIYNLDGDIVMQTWLPAGGGEGMHVLPEKVGHSLLVATEKGLTRFRISDANSVAGATDELKVEPALASQLANESQSTPVP